MITRRDVLGRIGGLSAAAAGALYAPAVHAQAMTRLRVGVVPVLDIAPLQAAVKLGFFKEEGLEIDNTPAPGGAAIMPALAAGNFDIAFSNVVSILLGIQEGLDFRFIAGAALNKPTGPDAMAVYAKADSGIKTVKDLAGKRLSSNTRNNIIWLGLVAWLDKNGVDYKSTNIVEVPFPQAADALMGGQIDAAALYEPFVASAVDLHGDKLVRLGFPYSEVASGMLIADYAAMSDYVAKNPGVIERFARAHAKGVDWVKGNLTSPKLEEIVQDYTKIPPERQRKMVFPDWDGKIPAAKLQQVSDLMKKFGLGGKLPPLDQIVHVTARA